MVSPLLWQQRPLAWLQARSEAETITKYPIAVGEYIDSGSPNNHFASNIKLVVNKPSNGTLTRGLVQMPNLPDVPASHVLDAKLWLNLTWDNESDPYSRGIVLYPLTQAFNASTATWNKSDASTFWPTPGGVYDATKGIVWDPPEGIPTSTNTNIWCSWDITSLWGDADLFRYGAILMFDQSEAKPSTGFITKQFSNSGAYQPYIEVASVPEPSTIALLLIASCMLAASVLASDKEQSEASCRGGWGKWLSCWEFGCNGRSSRQAFDFDAAAYPPLRWLESEHRHGRLR